MGVGGEDRGVRAVIIQHRRSRDKHTPWLAGPAGKPHTAAAMRDSSLPFVFALLASATTLACTEKAASSVVDAASDAPAEIVDDASGVTQASDVSKPKLPVPPDERGWSWSRTIVHVHSAWSHDACDGEIDKTGKANPDCVQQLRQGICNSGLDVVNLTDHPSHMKAHSFEELLLYDAKAGHQLVASPMPADPTKTASAVKPEPWANVIPCPATKELPAHEVVVTAGYEATHTMPVGLYRHYTQTDFEGQTIADEAPLAKARAAVDHAHAIGGLVVNAHSEEDDISAQRLVDSGLDAMEIYNTHANFKTIMGFSTKGAKSDFTRIFDLEHFLGDPATSPHPDLGLLIMLDIQPEAAFKKWQAVLGQRHVTGVIGNDVHQNVYLDPYCAPGGMLESACPTFAETAPKLVKLLEKGGPVILADGKRIDDYTRLLRWISIHALVKAGLKPAERPAASKEALKVGRVWAVYDVLGRPDGIDFFGLADGKVVEMGGTCSRDNGCQLQAQIPMSAAPYPWSPWTADDAKAATHKAILWHIAPGADKAVAIAEVSGWAGHLVHKPEQPGRYHVEYRMVPKHLAKPLKALGKYADKEQRWAVSNPIEVQ
jgi:hypothetical protein